MTIDHHSLKYHLTFSCLFSLYFLLCHQLWSQDTYSYVPLSYQDEIPDDFLTSFTEKYQRKVQGVSSRDKEEEKLQKEFYEESFYHINQLLTSGKILFNDPISKYVSRVADILLKDKPEIRQKLRFYTVRSSSVNALTSSEGIILINLGLFAHLKSEAELAFILCHEISHYVEEHPIDIFINNRLLFSQSRSSNFQKLAIQRALVETNKYSKEKEEEADFLGLSLYMESPYSLRSAVEVFDVLRNSEELFDEVIFQPSSFDSPYLQLPNSIFFDSFPGIGESQPEKLPTQSTHPSPKRRQTLIRRKVRKLDNSQRKEFILPKTEFDKLQVQGRFELMRQYLLEKKYERAIYLAMVLEKKFPNHPFLRQEMGYALYGLANYANYGRFWDVHLDFEEKNAPENRLNYFFGRLVDEEINLMAILYNWNLLKNQPNERNLRCLKAIIHQFGKAFFKSSYFDSLDDAGKNKSSLSYFKNGLKKALQDKEFKEIFDQAIQSDPQEYLLPLDTFDPANPLTKKQRKVQGLHFGLDHVIFIDPFFQHYDDRQESSLQYFESERSRKKLLSLINQYADELEVDAKIISPTNFDKSDTGAFNDLAMFKLWTLEKAQHEKMSWVGLYYEEMQALAKKYQTPYLISLGGIGIKQNRKSKNLTLGAGFLFFPILPYSLYYAFTPQQDFIFFSNIHDLKKDASNSQLSKRIRLKPSESVLHSQLYDFFIQIQQKPRD